MTKPGRRGPKRILTADIIRRIGKGGPPPTEAPREPIPERLLELLRRLADNENDTKEPR